MAKKLVLALVAILVGIVVYRSSTLVQVSVNDVTSWVKQQVPPETRIKQLRLEIAKIDKDVEAAVNKVVKVEMARNQLRDDVEGLKAKQKDRRDELKVVLDAVETGAATVTFRNTTYAGEEIQDRLDSMRTTFENGKDTLKLKEQVLKSKNEQLETADKQISKIREKKKELLALVEDLELKLEQLRLKQIENSIQVNDSQVSKAEALARDLKERIAEEDLKAEKLAKYGVGTTTRKEKDRASRVDSIRAAREALEDELIKK